MSDVGSNKKGWTEPASRVTKAFLVQVHADDSATCCALLQYPQYISGSAANFKNVVSGYQAIANGFENGADGTVARAEPKVTVFHGHQAPVSRRVITGISRNLIQVQCRH
jgi:hypothetical protein